MALKVDFDVELLDLADDSAAAEKPAPAAANDGDGGTTPKPSPPPPRAGATVFISRAPESQSHYVIRSESGAVLGCVPDSARLPPTPPPSDADGTVGAPAEVRSVRRRPGGGEGGGGTTMTLSVRVVLADGGRSWPLAPPRATAAAATLMINQQRHNGVNEDAANDDDADAAAAYRASPHELARLAVSGDVREALRDPRLQRLLREIDTAPDRERALRAALGLPLPQGPRGGGGAAAAAVATAAPPSAAAGALGVDGGAFQSFSELVLRVMDGSGSSGHAPG